MSVEHNADVVVPGLNPDLPPNPENPTGNLNPAVSGALEEGNAETGGDLDDAGKDAEKAKKAAGDLDDNEEDNEKEGKGIDTELSADGSGSPSGSPSLSSPSSGQSMPQQSMPQQSSPSMPQMSMPQMSMPQTQTPNASNMMKLPQGSLDKLLSGYNPKSDSGGGDKGDLGRAKGDGKVSGADAIDVSKVSYDKTGIGPLTDSELSAVIEEALDKNGISDDPKVRAQWHEVLTFMAEKESSRNPDAVNLTDSNAIGAPAADGHPGQSSRGIWQTIPTTFAANHVAGTSTNIYDPVACGAAAVNYIMNRYDVSASGGSSLQAFYSNRMGGGYTGY